MDSTETEDGQPPKLSTLSAVDLGRGGGMPGGGFEGGGMPQMPGGNLPDGNVPQMPDGDFSDGFTGGGWGGDRFTQWGQNQNQPQGGAADAASAVSPETFLPVGVSVLFLLAGIVIALKVKH